MPKRSHTEDDSGYIKRKIKKLERKLLRRRRKHRERDCSPALPSVDSPPPQSSDNEELEPPETESALVNIIPQDPIEPDTIAEPAESTAAAAPISTDPSADPDVTILDSELLEILGEDPTAIQSYGKEIHDELATRLKHYATVGLTKEMRKELTFKYLTPSNCTLIEPPILNAGVKAALSDSIVKRDKGMENKQKQLASAISCLSQAITLQMSSKTKDPEMLKLLFDTARLLCDSQFTESTTRKNFVMFTIKKEMRSQLQFTKIDKYLFFENLGEALKAAKAISRSGSDLKTTPTPKPQTQFTGKRPGPPTSKNWKGPPPGPRQPAVQRTAKEPAYPPARNRRMMSSRPSQPPRVNQNRR